MFSVLSIHISSVVGLLLIVLIKSSKQSLDASNPISSSCETSCPKGSNGQSCSGFGKCDCFSGMCHCVSGVIGTRCDFFKHKLTCENLRYCVQCKVYGSGPFADDNGCQEFCKEYPQPVIVTQLVVKKHEELCSFIDSSNSTRSCTFHFKLTNMPRTSQLLNHYTNDVFIVAQSHMDCISEDLHPRFLAVPISRNTDFVLTNEIITQVRDNGRNNSRTNYATMFFIFFFVSLPIVMCTASFVHNFRSLPCGLSNRLRRPSSTYLRNLRSYPGSLPQDSNPIVHI